MDSRTTGRPPHRTRTIVRRKNSCNCGVIVCGLTKMAYTRPTGPKTKLINGKSVTNLASYNFLNFANLERLRNKAVEVLHDYGVGACGPPGFYGTLGLTSFWLALSVDVHTQVELDLARFLGVEAAIIYAQAFSTVSSVIPDFSKRGDIIVAYRLNLRGNLQ